MFRQSLQVLMIESHGYAPRCCSYGPLQCRLATRAWNTNAVSHNSSATEIPIKLATQFRPQRILGEGAHSVVWLAEQVALHRPVALKLLKLELRPSDDQRGRFLDEAKITASLSHPNIVVIYDHGVEEDVPWIAYEYIPGLSLMARISEGPLSWREAVEAAAQISAALAQAHACGVIHRDVKPGNVIQAAPGWYKLGDFGLSRWTSGPVRTQTGAVVGTPAYLAPEVIRGFVASPASDVYALGAVFFEMVTGKRPFGHTAEASVLGHHLRTPPPLPSDRVPGLPAEVDEVVRVAMAKSPEERYAGAAKMQAALTSLLRVESIVSQRPRPRGAAALNGPGHPPSRLGSNVPASAVRVITPGPSVRRPKKTADPAVDPKGVRQPRRGQGSAVSSILTALQTRPVFVAGVLAIAIALIVSAVWVTGPHSAVAPDPSKSQASTPLPGLTLLSTVPLPPVSARVQYSLQSAPSSAQFLEARASGQVASRASLNSANGTVVFFGLSPGKTYEMGLSGAPPAGRLSMPRPLAVWSDFMVEDTVAWLSAWSLEPLSLDVRVTRVADGKEVFVSRDTGSHRIHHVLRGLTPATRYFVRLRPLDPTLFIPVRSGEWWFETENRVYARWHRTEVSSLFAPRLRDSTPATPPKSFSQVDDSVSLMIKGLNDPRVLVDDYSRLMLENLSSHGRDPREVPALIHLLNTNSNPRDLLVVADCLAWTHDPRGFEPITAQSARDRFPLASMVQESYSSWLVACDPARARTHFRAVADKPKAFAMLDRLALASAMGVLGAPELIGASVKLALDDPARMGVAAAKGLSAIGGEEARRALCRLLDPACSIAMPETVLTALLSAWGKIGQPKDVTAILGHGRSDRVQVRVRVAEALGQIGGPSAVRALLTLLGDPDPVVRRTAAFGLGQQKAREAVGALVARLGDAAGSAGRVPRALGQIGDPRVAARLLDLVQREPAAGDVAGRLDRAESLWALGRLRVSAARSVLERALSRGSLYERFRAAEALGLLGDPKAIAALDACQSASKHWPAITDAVAWSLRALRSGHGPRGRMVVVDADSEFIRTGVVLEAGEDALIEAVGLRIDDTRGLINAQWPPDAVKNVNQMLIGMVEPWGRSLMGKGRIQECTRYGGGELLLSLSSKGDSRVAAGFATVWIDGGTAIRPENEDERAP